MPEDTRASLKVQDNILEMCQQAEQVLRDNPQQADIFFRGKSLAQIHFSAKGATIHTLSLATLTAIISGAIRWLRWKKGKNGEPEAVPVLPPREVVAALHAAGTWKLRELRGLLHAPTLREDGSILIAPGYDPETALFFAPTRTAENVRVRQSPSRDDAIRAIRFLEEVFIDFPFAAQQYQSACFAALMTLLIRPSIDSFVPIFAVEAPARGTGKSNLVRLLGSLATGGEPIVTPPPRDDHEDIKRLTIQVQNGLNLIFVDNVLGLFGSQHLAALITASIWGDRVIGSSEIGPWPNHTVWFVTGNNLTFHPEIIRRVLSIYLDSGMENPTQRKGFTHPDFMHFAADVRPKVLAACLTILRAYIVAGRPLKDVSPCGSFERWSTWVREPLIWLERADPVLTQARVREENDTEEQQFARAIAAWHVRFGDVPQTLRDAVDCENSELLDALQVLSPGKGRDPIDLKILGYIFQRNKGRPFGNLVCRAAGKSNRGQRYRVAKTDEQPKLELMPDQAEAA